MLLETFYLWVNDSKAREAKKGDQKKSSKNKINYKRKEKWNLIIARFEKKLLLLDEKNE